MSGFEGFDNNSESSGGPIFPAKNEPMEAPGNGALPPGHPQYEDAPRKIKSLPLPKTFA